MCELTTLLQRGPIHCHSSSAVLSSWDMETPIDCELWMNRLRASGITFWRWKSSPTLSEIAWVEFSLDNAVQTSATRYDWMMRSPQYAAQWATYCWLFAPLASTLKAFSLSDGRWLLQRGFVSKAEVSVASLGDIAFPLTALWEGGT